MDFYKISMKELRDRTIQLYPDWTVGRFKDLMVRGKSFYAIWDEKAGMWSTDEYEVQRLVDEDLSKYAHENQGNFKVSTLKSFNSNGWLSFRKFVMNISDNSHTLDDNITFANTPVQKSDYVSKRFHILWRKDQPMRGTNLWVFCIPKRKEPRLNGQLEP
jgi:hypothetical protein